MPSFDFSFNFNFNHSLQRNPERALRSLALMAGTELGRNVLHHLLLYLKAM